jgi:hypothetical protein
MRFVLLGLCLGLAGCVRAPSAAPEAAPTPVTVSRPVERDVIDYLTLATYRVALGTRTRGTWLDLQLDLWKALADTVETWGRNLPRCR